MQRTHYDILQVSKDASTEVVRSAYYTIMSKLRKHPDLGGDPAEAKRINEAYETLSNPKLRAKYDEGLHKGNFDVSEEASIRERRRAPRFNVTATVSFSVGHDNLWHSARVKDVSVLGIRLLAHTPFEVGDHLVIMPTNLAAPAMHGTVKWKRMYHPSNFERVYEAGIEFSDQISDIRDRIS